MRKVYPKTLNLNAAVADPRIMGLVREEGGKMHMAEENWEEAYNELYESFRNYQEAGNSRAKTCLKYVVLASMLSLKGVNPFAAREAKVYNEDKEILAMKDLRESLEANDIDRFEKTLRNPKNRILDEPFLMKYLEPLRRRMREQVLLNLTKPYSKVTLSFLARELSMDVSDIELILMEMISDGKLPGLLDQLNDSLALFNQKKNSTTTTTTTATAFTRDTALSLSLSPADQQLIALSKWAGSLERLTEGLVHKPI